jgi:aspartate carbamoyltransferase catalytic subunit
MDSRFYGRDLISVKDLSFQDIEYIFELTERLQAAPYKFRKTLGEGKVIGLLFFEPSTRTKLSFEAAAAALGSAWIGFDEPQRTSLAKGENLHDTVKVVEGYVDALIIRHPMEGASKYAAMISEKPVINAGSGTEEHPTQALLDLYTIWKIKGSFDGLKIGILGDLKYSRTVPSLLYGLAKMQGDIEVRLVSPTLLRLRREILEDISGRLKIIEHNDLKDCISELDVLYVTRIQRERFPDPNEYEKVRGSYKVSSELLEHAKADLIILHPLPRTEEIVPEVDRTKFAYYFKQAHYGLWVRAALLASILNQNIELA